MLWPEAQREVVQLKKKRNLPSKANQSRGRSLASERKGISVQQARKYYRKKDHHESPTIFWKKKK